MIIKENSQIHALTPRTSSRLLDFRGRLEWSGSVVPSLLSLTSDPTECSMCIFFFKQKTAYEVPLCDWSSDGALPIEEHTSELQSHSGISYAVFCLEFRRLLFDL